MSRPLQVPPLDLSFRLDLEGEMSCQGDRWSGAESPEEESVPHKMGFSPLGGRLLKSESEDSGMEMASNDHSPSSPVGSERSFFLDFADDFQPSAEDSPPPAPYESCPHGEGREMLPGPVQEGTCPGNLSEGEEAAQPDRPPLAHDLPRCSHPPASQKPCSPGGLEGSPQAPWPMSIDALIEMVDGGDGPSDFVCHPPEVPSVKGKVKNEALLTMPGQGLLYLEHICQMLEKIAQLQRTNLQLQRQQKDMERCARAQEFEKKGFFEETPESSGLPTWESQLENSAAIEMEAVAEEGPSSSTPWLFRARSASDTRALRRPANTLRSKADRSRKAAMHAVSSPSDLDQLDGVSLTLPPGLKLKSEHSHWCRIKGLFNRITRRSVRTNELTSCVEPALSSRHSREEVAKDKQESHHRWRFLSSLGPQKRRSKHLSMQ